jgi:hypothetical protein
MRVRQRLLAGFDGGHLRSGGRGRSAVGRLLLLTTALRDTVAAMVACGGVVARDELRQAQETAITVSSAGAQVNNLYLK